MDEKSDVKSEEKSDEKPDTCLLKTAMGETSGELYRFY